MISYWLLSIQIKSLRVETNQRGQQRSTKVNKGLFRFFNIPILTCNRKIYTLAADDNSDTVESLTSPLPGISPFPLPLLLCSSSRLCLYLTPFICFKLMLSYRYPSVNPSYNLVRWYVAVTATAILLFSMYVPSYSSHPYLRQSAWNSTKDQGPWIQGRSRRCQRKP